MAYKKFNSDKHDLEAGDEVKVCFWGKSRIGTVKRVKWPSRVLVEVPYTEKERRETGGYGENTWFETTDIKISE